MMLVHQDSSSSCKIVDDALDNIRKIFPSQLFDERGDASYEDVNNIVNSKRIINCL
jgi:hypothetical protein